MEIPTVLFVIMGPSLIRMIYGFLDSIKEISIVRRPNYKLHAYIAKHYIIIRILKQSFFSIIYMLCLFVSQLAAPAHLKIVILVLTEL